MRILYLTYDGLTDPLGQSQILPYLKGLTTQGHSFIIVSLEKPDFFQQKKSLIEEAITDLPIKWLPQIYDKRTGIRAKFKNNQTIKRAAIEAMRGNSVQLLHCRSYPASLIGLSLKNKFNLPLLFDMRGFWADERIDGKIWNLSKPLHRFLYRYFKRKEQLLLKHSSHIISLTQAAKNHIVNTLCKSIEPEKITVIPCCADLNLFQPKGKDLHLLQQLQIRTDQKIMLYSGSVGTWYMMDEMVDLFKLFREKIPHAVFLILTNDHELVHQTMKKKNLEPAAYRVIAVNRSDMPRYISLADLGLYFIKPAFSKMASSPVKLGEYMACGCPVICNSGIGDIDEHAQLTSQITLTHDFNEPSYRKAMDTALNKMRDQASAMQFAHSVYALENGIKSYGEVYTKLGSGQH